MKLFIFFLTGVMQLPLAFAGEINVQHHFKKGETLWFLSQVYYGKGEQYKKIMEANHLATVDSVKEDDVLQIPNTMWKNDSPDFDDHYHEMWRKREAKLHPSVKTVVTLPPKMENQKKVLIVPIPSSPIFPTTATEGVNH